MFVRGELHLLLLATLWAGLAAGAEQVVEPPGVERIVVPALPPAGLREPDRLIDIPDVDWIQSAIFTPDGQHVIAWCVKGMPQFRNGQWQAQPQTRRLLEIDLMTGFVSGELPLPADSGLGEVSLLLDDAGQRLVVTGRKALGLPSEEEQKKLQPGMAWPITGWQWYWHVYDLPSRCLLASHNLEQDMRSAPPMWQLSHDGNWLWMTEGTDDGWRLLKRDLLTFEPTGTWELNPPVVPQPSPYRWAIGDKILKWLVNKQNDRLLVMSVPVQNEDKGFWLAEIDLGTQQVLRRTRIDDPVFLGGVQVDPSWNWLSSEHPMPDGHGTWAYRDIRDLNSLQPRYLVDMWQGDLFGSLSPLQMNRYLFIFGSYRNDTYVAWRYDLQQQTWSWPRLVNFTQGGTRQDYGPGGDRMIAYNKVQDRGNRIAFYTWRDDEQYDIEQARRWADAMPAEPPPAPLPTPRHRLTMPPPPDQPRGPDRIVSFEQIGQIRHIALSSTGRYAWMESLEKTEIQPPPAEGQPPQPWKWQSVLWWVDLDENKIIHRIELSDDGLSAQEWLDSPIVPMISDDDRFLIAIMQHGARSMPSLSPQPARFSTVRFWDAETGELRCERRLADGEHLRYLLNFDDDTCLVSILSSEQWRIERWSLATLQTQQIVLQGDRPGISAPDLQQQPFLEWWALSPGGDELLTVLSRTMRPQYIGHNPQTQWVQVFDPHTGQPIRRSILFDPRHPLHIDRLTSRWVLTSRQAQENEQFKRLIQVWPVEQPTIEVEIDPAPDYAAMSSIISRNNRYLFFANGNKGDGYLLWRLDLDTMQWSAPRDRDNLTYRPLISADGNRAVLQPLNWRQSSQPMPLAVFDW